MIFSSFNFIVFFILVSFLYYFPLKEKTKEQNCLLLFSSYFFYGFTDLKMIPLLLIATIIFYSFGIAIHKTKNQRKSSWLTTLGVLSGIGVLLYFKYFNFFIESFGGMLNAIGLHTNWNTFNIIMPLGISFFTFKLISYVIEVHRGKMEPTKDFVAFATYISFFPTIMAGPIDRPNTFIPQLHQKRPFEYDLAVDGCRQILWGIFKKVVLADNLAIFTEQAWGNIQGSSGSTLLLAAIFYSFQIYTDFSGYSDIAIGIGKILGFRITKNFSYPLFATNIADYWRKWHISLTSWLTDYVFMPLNVKFRNLGNRGIIFAIIINMIIIGMWHGANWTFAVFGLYHGLLFVPLILSGSYLKKKILKPTKYGLPTLIVITKMISTFMLITVGLVIFRAENIEQALDYFNNIFSPSLITIPKFVGLSRAVTTIILVAIFVLTEWFGREGEYAIANIGSIFKRSIRWALYAFVIFLIGMYMQTKETPFIYFHF